MEHSEIEEKIAKTGRLLVHNSIKGNFLGKQINAKAKNENSIQNWKPDIGFLKGTLEKARIKNYLEMRWLGHVMRRHDNKLRGSTFKKK